VKELFRNSTFVKLFVASFASQMGTVIGNMAFAFYMLDRFASRPAYASLAEMMYSLPTLAVFFIVGVLADRLDRQRIAQNTGWIRVVLSLTLFGALFLDLLPLVFAILFLRSAVAKFYAPAETGILQGILEKEQYVVASGLNQMIFGVFMLFGVGLGAVAYSTVGIKGAVLIDACGFVLSALLIRSCRIRKEVRLPNGQSHWKDIRAGSVFRDFREGFVYVLHNRLLLALIGGFCLFGFLNGAFAVLPMFTMKYKLAPDSYQKFASLFAIFLGIGFLLGSSLGASLVKRFKPHVVMIGGLLIAGALIGLLGTIANPWVYLALVLVLGTVLAPINIALGGWLPHIVDPAKMGRVSAWIDPVLMFGQSATLGLISLLYPRFISLEVIYAMMAVVTLAAFVFFLLTLPRLAKRAEQTAASNGSSGGGTAAGSSVSQS
jgi:predicted MFS family arabinose efflux permease